MNIKDELEKTVGKREGIYLNGIEIDPLAIKAIMINEVVPLDPKQDFYGEIDADYMKTTLSLFQGAGANVTCIGDIINRGIYITNAVKEPKTQYTIEKGSIDKSLPYLEKELSLFLNVKVIMLMGDTAKKAFNQIAKKVTKKNVIPSLSTYKIRMNAFYYGDIRVMPSYIMTGGNILIEKSKMQMATEDIATMLKLIK